MKRPVNEWKNPHPQLPHFLEQLTLLSEKNWAMAQELRFDQSTTTTSTNKNTQSQQQDQEQSSRVRFHMLRRFKKSLVLTQQLLSILNELKEQQEQEKQEEEDEKNVFPFPIFQHQHLTSIEQSVLEVRILQHDLMVHIEMENEQLVDCLSHLIQMIHDLKQWQSIVQKSSQQQSSSQQLQQHVISNYLARKYETLEAQVRYCSYQLGVTVDESMMHQMMNLVGGGQPSVMEQQQQQQMKKKKKKVDANGGDDDVLKLVMLVDGNNSKRKELVVHLDQLSDQKLKNLLKVKISDLESQVEELTSQGHAFESRHMRLFDQLVFSYMEAEKMISRELQSIATSSPNVAHSPLVEELKNLGVYVNRKLVSAFVKRNIWNMRHVIGERQSMFVESMSSVDQGGAATDAATNAAAATSNAASRKPYDLVKILDTTLHRMNDPAAQFATLSPYAVLYMQTLRVLFLALSYYVKSREAECQLLSLKGQQMVRELESMSADKDAEPLCLHLLPRVNVIQSEFRKLNVLVRAKHAQHALNLSASVYVPEDEDTDASVVEGGNKYQVTQFPPAYESIACKPTFFDIAANGIEYPEAPLSAATGEASAAATTTKQQATPTTPAEEEPKKKGWFGLW